jgi:hypothetical protein
MDTGSIAAASSLFSSSLATGAASSRLPAVRHHGRHGHHGFEAHRTEAPADGTATLRYRRSERAALYIQTQEGDVVRLRIKVRDAATATVSDGSGTDTPVAELSVSARSSVKVSFHVDGNLNADELAAIQDVVAQVGALADQFFAGDVPAAFASAQDLNIDASQLAKVGLRLSQRQSVTYSGPALSPPAPSTDQPAPAESPPAPQATAPVVAASSEPVANVAPSDVPAAPVDEPSAAADTPPSTAAVEAAATDSAPAAPTPPSSVTGNVLATIGSFLHQLLDALGTPAEEPDATSQASLDVSLKLRLFASVVVNIAAPASTPSTGDAATTAPLVADTLDALAATQEPPLRTNA